jgi:hypothetical protein
VIAVSISCLRLACDPISREVSRRLLVLRLLFCEKSRKSDDVCVDRLSFPVISVGRHDVLVCVWTARFLELYVWGGFGAESVKKE